MDTTPPDMLAYVKCAAALLDLPLDDAQAQRVALHLARTASMAAALQQVPLTAQHEPVEVFSPAPFPQEDPR